MRLPSTILTILTILVSSTLLPAQEHQLSGATLDKLDRLIQTFVDEEEIVGAELLVIKGGESILHEAYGWRDRESKTAMELDSVFCVRSMTKPLIGTAILMLVEEGKLRLEDPVALHLPEFEAEPTAAITIEQLLTHTSGMSMSRIMAADLQAIDGIQAVAAMGAGQELEFAPGSAFNYSDQGTDTLTAVIEVVSGIPAEEFVQSRILDPMGMQNSACLMSEDHPLRARGCSKYAGSAGAWIRFWDPEQPPLFPFFLGSQGLYATVQDYAKFMEFWKDLGTVGDQRLLDAALMRKALTPGPHHPGFPTDIPTLSVDYGFLMTLWTPEGMRSADIIAFGHNGSDGTHAWVFPEHDAMVFYFTQSRGTPTGMRVGAVLAELFLDVAPPEVLATPPLEQYLGYYWEHDDDSYRAVVRDGDDLALEIHGKVLVPLDYIGEDSWQLRPNPNEILVFDRSEDGEVSGFHSGDHQEYRFMPSDDLPSVDELAGLIAKTHRLDRLESVGPMRIVGEIDMKKLNIKGTFEATYAWPNRFRNDGVVNGQFEHAAFDGEVSSHASSAAPASILEGLRAEQQRMDNYFARFGDWHQWHPRLEVIQHLVRGGKEIYLVRAGDTSAPAITYFVDADSGRVLGEDKVMLLDGMGMVGLRIRFDDFRDVSGMLLPYTTQVKLSNPMIGSIYSTVSSYELGVELPEGVFRLVE